MKTVASLNESNEAREQRFLNDVLRRARNLDAEYPGSSFEKTLMSYGQNGKYLVLVDGPFGNLSEGFNVLVDFLARVHAFRQINPRGMRKCNFLIPIIPTYLSVGNSKNVFKIKKSIFI